MSSLIEQICADLTVPPQLIDNALDLAHIRYRKIRIPKRSGGYRTAIQPAAELKLIQQWLMTYVLSKLPVSSIATAFQPGTSIVKNAHLHQNSHYSVRVDLEKFFPSLKLADFRKLLATMGLGMLPSGVTELEFDQFISKACFDREGSLPIGYLTSPCIANALMYEFDKELEGAVTKDVPRFGNAVLTRYADDFVFSSDKRGACHEFLKSITELSLKTDSPKLRVNSAKTRYMSRAGGTTLVTGLRINQVGLVRVHANYRDHVRLLLKLYSSGNLKEEDVQRLRGHVAFVEHADPRLFTRLSFRYHEEITRLRLG